MLHCICGTCGKSFDTEQTCCCPNCGSMEVYVKSEGNTVGVFGTFDNNTNNTFEPVSEKPQKETVRAEDGYRDNYYADNPASAKRPEKKKKTWIIWAAVLGAVLVAGIVLLIVFMGNDKKKDDTGTGKKADVSSETGNNNKSNESDKGNISFELKTVSSFSEKEKIWTIKDGVSLTARTGGVYYVEMLSDDEEDGSDGFSMSSSNTSLVEISGNKIIVNELKEYDTVKVTVSADGKDDICFYLNVKHGGWNEIDGDWYYIEETDEPLTGWLQIYEDEQDRAYYLKKDGKMVSSTTITFGSGDEAYACKFDRLGRLYDSWLVRDGNVYRYGPEKVMLKNTTVSIGDGTYRFDENGIAYSAD